jgi:nucleoside-diphosphate-sugar epimerase
VAEKFLVTGGQGFLGAWIVRQLLLEGEAVEVLDRAPDDRILAQVIAPEAVARLRRHHGDISDPEFVANAVRRSEAARIIHLAGVQIPACRADPVAGARVNVIGTINVFEAARLSKAVQVVVYASSAAAAGPPEDYPEPIPDDARREPRTHYGVFKIANEGAARVSFHENGIQSVGLRPLVVYGAGREVGLTSGATKAIKAAVLGRPYAIGFTGRTGFLYAEDAAAIFIACARSRPEGALALNVRGTVAPVEEFAGILMEEVKEAAGTIRCEGAPIPVAFDVEEKGLEELLGSGKVPGRALERGIRATIEIFRGLQREARLHDRDLFY